jgi:hypothetical protein
MVAPRKEQRGEWGGTRSRLVSIDHQGRVLVGFTVRENYSLATRESPGLSFHILCFTSDGKGGPFSCPADKQFLHKWTLPWRERPNLCSR